MIGRNTGAMRPPKTRVRYTVVVEDEGLQQLESRVEELLNDGWQLVGGALGLYSHQVYAQTLIKHEPIA